MAEITAAAVKALRDKTDLPMMKCKQALVEAEGDEAKAIEILKQEYKKVQEKRADNLTAEGQVFIQVADDGMKAAMVEIQCESAPVGTGEDLTNFGNDLAAHLLHGPGAASVEELMSQTCSAASESFNDRFEEMVGKIREKIVVNRILCVDGPVAGYVHHNKKCGVLFSATGEKSTAPILRDVAMHIAALKPIVTNPEELDAELVNQEKARLTEEAKATGKPDNIIEKIVAGRMNTFYVEQGVLVNQPFAKDDSKTVKKALEEAGLTAGSFHRWVIGN